MFSLCTDKLSSTQPFTLSNNLFGCIKDVIVETKWFYLYIHNTIGILPLQTISPTCTFWPAVLLHNIYIGPTSLFLRIPTQQVICSLLR